MIDSNRQLAEHMAAIAEALAQVPDDLPDLGSFRFNTGAGFDAILGRVAGGIADRVAALVAWSRHITDGAVLTAKVHDSGVWNVSAQGWLGGVEFAVWDLLTVPDDLAAQMRSAKFPIPAARVLVNHYMGGESDA